MIQFLLSLIGVATLMVISFFGGIWLISYGLQRNFKSGTKAVLITYDKINNKMTILDDEKFTYEVFDKNKKL